jgi:hypothetical protein
MAETENKTSTTTRIQLAKVVSLDISPARIRHFLDAKGINLVQSENSDLIKSGILDIKKEGGPAKPTAPEHLKGETTEAQKQAYKAAKAKYDEALAAYDKYVSPKYLLLDTVYTLVKNLIKVHALLIKEKKTENNDKELEVLKVILDDKPAPRKEKETDETYKKRVEEFQSLGFAKYLGSTDLDNPEEVSALINSLKNKYVGLDLFFNKDNESRNRTRFNSAAAVALATATQTMLETLLEDGMENTLKQQKKTLQPDHCVTDNITKNPWYSLLRDLRHFKAVTDRKARKKAWVLETEKERARLMVRARTTAKRTGKEFVRPKIEFPSFQETEVKNEYAFKEERDDKGKKKTYYHWYGIDAEKEDDPNKDDFTFNFYIGQICHAIINRRGDSGDSRFDMIKISYNVKKFCSDLIIDLIAKMSPIIRELITIAGVKTIGDNIICSALRIMLYPSYADPTGNILFGEEHQQLFDLITDKVDKCIEHQTGVTEKEDVEVEKEEKVEVAKLGHAKDPTGDVVDEDEENLDDLTDEKKAPSSPPTKAMAAVAINGESKKLVNKVEEKRKTRTTKL